MTRPRWTMPRTAVHVATLLVLLAAGTAPPAGAAGEPGPVPLVRDADQVMGDAAAPRPAPAGLGDWRLVAALGGTFAVLVGVRFAGKCRVTPPPPDVFEVLGTASLGGHHAVRIVRFGPKTLLVGVSAAGATTLAEIADAQATACIAAACRSDRAAARPAGRVTASVAGAPPRVAVAKEVA